MALGVVMLAAVLTPALVPTPKLGDYYATLNKLKLAMRQQLKRRNLLAGYTVGLLNGFLPCGLVYLALAGAMATYHPLEGAAYMAAFGLGTLPLMIGLTTLGPLLTPALRARFRAAVPYVVGVMGVVLILRGLDLGIPYLSPVLPETVQAEVEVCH
ncbi:MAG TPA: hypothetical protein DCE41_10250 [Cytophagales bacterium]|nr:hypothetical protein [Cytophagales bacterium]